jgi:OOP family OmpA-OmpF porin
VAGSTNRSASESSEIFFPNVNFDFNKRGLSSEGQRAVEGIAQTLKSRSNVTVVLEGHTDYVGSKSYNQKLGMDRANAVRSALEGMGIDASRLSTVSFGELHPLDPAKTDAARATNRRVEVKSK